MKPTPKVLLALAIIVSSAVLVELFTVLPRPAENAPQGQVLGIMTWVKKQAAKLKINVKKKASPTRTRVGATPPSTVPPASPSQAKSQTKPNAGIVPSPAPSPAAATPPSIPPHQGEGKKSEGVDTSSLEREITILYEGGNPLGPEHYNRLQSELDSKAAAGADAAKIKNLRDMLETVNPAKVTSTSPSPSPQAANCVKTNPVLSADITDFPKIQKITAPGSGSSEGPKGHSFIWTGGERVPVYAPVAGVLDSGAYYTGGDGATQYILTFQVKNICDFVFKFDHIDEPVERIRNVFPLVPRPTEDTRGEKPVQAVSLGAGELIGYTRGTRQARNWDFGLYDMSQEGPLAVAGSTGQHRHAVCWVDFFASSKQAQYRGLLEGPKLVCSF